MVHVLLMFFTDFKNLKSSFSEDNMPVNALDVFPKQHNGKFWVHQRMGIMHSDVMDTVFHSGDAWDSMPQI